MNKEFKWTAELLAEFIRDYGDREGPAAELMEQFKESKQTKPEWEIWAYQHKQTKEIAPKGSMGFCKAMYDSAYEIYRVMRLSDGEVFTIGDRVKYHKTSHYGWYIIEGFFVRGDGQLLAKNKDQNIVEYITEIVKAPEPLFTTEDGVAIYKGDNYYFINTEWEVMYTAHNYNWVGDNLRAFSTKEKAEEYILMNKPLFSVNEIASKIINYSMYKDNYVILLVEKAKEKLNKP